MIDLHTMQSTNIDMLTSLRSNPKSRHDPLQDVYIPFVHERDHLGNLVSKKNEKKFKSISVSSFKNITPGKERKSMRTKPSGLFSI